MPEQQTCGTGLAQRSSLPRAMGEVIDALSANLERHIPALDSRNPAARHERDAYQSLALQYRAIATELRAAADEMAGYRDLPPAPHDMAAISGPAVVQTFETFVERERKLHAEVTALLAQDDRMLTAMKAR